MHRIQRGYVYYPGLILVTFAFMFWERSASASVIMVVNPQDIVAQPALEEEGLRVEKIGNFWIEWEFLGTKVRFFNGAECTEFNEDAPIHSASLDFCDNDENCMIAVSTKLGTKLHLFKLEDISREQGVSVVPCPAGSGLTDFVRVSRGAVFCGSGYVYDQTRNQFAHVPINGNWIEAYHDNGFFIVAFDPFLQRHQKSRSDSTLQLAVFDPQDLQWVSDPSQIDFNFRPKPLRIKKPSIVARRMTVRPPFVFLYETRYRGPHEPPHEVAVEVLDSQTLKKLWAEKANSQVFVHPEGKFATFVGRNNEAVLLVNLRNGKVVRELRLPTDVLGYFVEPISYDGRITTVAISVQRSRSQVVRYFYAWNLEGVDIEAAQPPKHWVKKKWSKLAKLRIRGLAFRSKA